MICPKKKIVIVGGSGSIGSTIAREFVNNQFEPHLIGRNFSALKNVSEELNCSYEVADVTKTDDLIKAIGKCGENIFGLAYCAGSIDLKPLSLAHENDYIESFKVNTLGAISAIKATKDILKKNKGSILLFSSIAVKNGFMNHSIISTSKGGIEALTVSLAAELAPDIRVNCIAPSLTESGMTKAITSNQNIKKAIELLHPIPRIGQPSDHSKLAAYLLSDANAWITGQIFNIDGGRSTLRRKG
ncbi:MAG: short-chain dehydrogenase [Pelagibacteraceae bacterium]|nr:short-chain dehydrogenase [Pelagibacteraceae bacterium]